jgi:transcriptional regulator with XRE-family HTH domain
MTDTYPDRQRIADNIGDILSRRSVADRLSYGELANRLGMNRNTITGRMAGRTEFTGTELSQLRRILRVTANDLLGPYMEVPSATTTETEGKTREEHP